MITGLLKLTKREAGGLIGAMLWASTSFKLGKSQISMLRKVFQVWPDLYDPELWPELEKGREITKENP